MPRQTPFPLLAGILMAALAAPSAYGQSIAPAGATDPLTPLLDGNPQTFRKAGAVPLAPISPAGQLQSYGYQGSIGAGTTGFNSSNTRSKGRNGAGLSAQNAADPNAPDATAQPGSAAPTPLAPLLPPNAISSARLKQNQNRTRHGAPPPDPGSGNMGTNGNAAGGATGANASATGLGPGPGAAVPAVDPTQNIPRALVRRPVVDDKPFDPTGITAGSFRLRPAIELSTGYDTNPARTTVGGGASDLGIVAPELLVNSNWSRHELTADLRGSYSAYGAQPPQDRPAFTGKIDGRIDVIGQTRIDLESRTVVGTDSPGSPNIQAGLVRLPVFADVGGSVGVGQQFNRLDVELKTGIDRTTYQRSTFTDGSIASNDDRNFDQYSTQLRAGYELLPGLKPFVEIDVDRRHHDLAVDDFGYMRDSNGRAEKIGSTFEFSRLLTGQLAFGYLERSYGDPRLSNLSGPSFDASLTWLATALTTVKLSATTVVNESTLPGISGVFTHEVGLEVDHAFRTWLDMTIRLVGDQDSDVGSDRVDDRYVASMALIYKLTREMQLKSELRREWLSSNIAGNNYQAYVALLGVRLQR